MATTPHLLIRRLPLLLPLRRSLAGISTSPPVLVRWWWHKTSTAEQATHKESVSRAAMSTTVTSSASFSSSSADVSETEGSDDLEKWIEIKEEILNDIMPITSLVRDILHSNKYMNGDILTDEDEKNVVDKLLKYHPNADKKIGCGVDSIMVDHHPQFRGSRCMIVVRTDGGGIDFSYRKCLRAYIMQKYPLHAERFIRGHKYLGSD